ncbi:hypothetical protein [Corynebacterium sp. Marseille-P3884]|uniref:hypothetical protein n=1 Tax=Corynebacterium sp. Marseille-P3884 TaxID=2495409 RepID=UPI001B328BE7|nr:hypothetical protein [Corynebacterium sp. Marseille-P3884]MBP3948657.1 hypothetical protein [Corynebacterium sp. Marseille-P3884]
MGYILLGLSALALAGASILWRADAQDKSRTSENDTAPRDAEPAEDVRDEPVLREEAAPAEPEPQPEVVPEKEPEPQLEAEEKEEPQPEPEAQPEPEPEPEVHPEPAEENSEESQKTHSRWSALTGAFSTKLPSKLPTKLPKHLPSKLPGAKQRSRKERREWAEANGFEYAREDEFLQDEWGRGAASAGEPVTDVLTGTRFGHETRIADIGGTTVVAMGTGMESGVVVDVRRKATASGATEDLVAVAEIEGFRVYGSEAGPVERMLDIRVNTALELLPQQVSAVWFESEWALAQLDGDAGAQEWEPVFAPLALLADAARTLPPRTWPHLHFEHRTREMGDPIEAETSAGGGENEMARPVVARPEEPLEMPTRTTGGVRGTMEYRAVGGDDVDAIATGEAPEQLNDGTRITRRPQPPSIFGDGNADYPG